MSTRIPIVKRQPLPKNYRHQVAVQFHDSVEPPPLPGGQAHVAATAPRAPSERPSWEQLLRNVPGATVARMTQGLNPEKLRRAETLARRVVPELPRLENGFKVTLPPGVSPEAVLAHLRAWPGVRHANVRPLPAPLPVVTPADDTLFSQQAHLSPAPGGIDAAAAWAVAGGDGAGVGFVDIEYGWNLAHEDLLGASIGLISGTNAADGVHGTKALGVVAARDNTVGVVGIAPAVRARVCGSLRPTLDHFGAILDSTLHMVAGDVLLLEQQHGDYVPASLSFTNYRPIEVDWWTYWAIRIAVANGIVVVQAGGNGTVNLDTWNEPGAGKVLSVGDAAFRDSGAIIVGAGSSAVPHTPMWFTASGRRIDCYAWGENVVTTTSLPPGQTNALYTRPPAFVTPFSGTSSGSAVIAGIACVTQSIYKSRSGGNVLTSQQMRAVFRRRGTSADLTGWAGGPIGRMPDLAAIIANEVDSSHPVPPPL